MHDESMKIMRAFVRGLSALIPNPFPSVLDVGSRCVGGTDSYRQLFSPKWKYVGMDIEAGDNVDIVIEDHYRWSDKIESDRFDLVISGQAFEHIEFPWITLRQIKWVLKDGGYAVLIAPSAGWIHRYPVDCWRILPDGWRALAAYTNMRVIRADVSQVEPWKDSFCLLQKPGSTPIG